ncbi:MAG: ferredoxin family protein [Anaerolineaceae bacterium]|nr:ferredoxin family protein [Anaerolineaceae bacterium]
MPRVITNLCLRDSSCVEVCPVDCISPGEPVEEYPTYYIDPDACIDCGACETECPNSAIYELSEVPEDFEAEGGEVMSAALETEGFAEVYKGEDRDGEPVQIPATRILKAGEIVDLTGAIKRNAAFFTEGPGYSTQK